MKLKQKNLKNSAVILIISGVIAKILAALYRFPYQNLVGDLGFYAYQQVYPIMAIITTISLVALPNFIAKAVTGQSKSSRASYLSQFFQITSWLSFFLFLIIVLLSKPLAMMMGEIKLYPVIMAGSLPLLCTPLLSVYRGYYQSQGELDVTAKSQVVEQLVRVMIIWLGAYLFGAWQLDVYRTAIIAMLGSTLGELVAILTINRRLPFKLLGQRIRFSEASQLLVVFFKDSLNFIYFAIFLLLFQLVDAFTVKNALVASGLANFSAQVEKGVFDRAQPFVQLGLTITLAIISQALPQLTYTYQTNRAKYQQLLAQKIKVITVVSLAITVGMLLVIDLMNQVLFKDNQGITAISCYLLAIFLLSMIQVLHHHYEIVGRRRINIYFLSGGLVSKLILTYFLTKTYGILGSSLSTIISLLIVFLCYFMCEYQRFYFNKKFMISLALMAVIVTLAKQALQFDTRFEMLIEVLLLSAIGAGVLIVCLLKFKVISWDELK